MEPKLVEVCKEQRREEVATSICSVFAHQGFSMKKAVKRAVEWTDALLDELGRSSPPR